MAEAGSSPKTGCARPPGETARKDAFQQGRFSFDDHEFLALKVSLQQVAGADLDEAGGGAVGAGEPFAAGDGGVHREVDGAGRREDGTKDGGGAHVRAGQPPEPFRGGEGNAGDAQGAAEVAGDEGLVVGRDVEVEFRLLAVAQEDGLDDGYAGAGADVGAVFHRDAGVCVHAGEGDPFRGKCLINKRLQGRLVTAWRRGEGLADVESEEFGAQGWDAVHEAVAGQFFRAAVAPGHGEGVDAAVRGGAHVGGGIADHQGVFRCDAGFCEHLADDLRGGFERPARSVAEDGDEGDAGEEAPDEVFGAFLEFVGGDGQAYSFRVELIDELRDAGVRAREGVDVGLVVGFEIAERLVHQGFGRGGREGCFQRPLHEIADAVTHHVAVLLRAVQRQAALFQRVVHRRAEVFQCVQQGAVQVEEDQLFHGIKIRIS